MTFFKGGNCEICGKRRGGKNAPRHDKCSKIRQNSPDSKRIQEERKIIAKERKAIPSFENRQRKPTSFNAINRRVI